MTRTGRIVVTLLLIVMLAAAADAQTQATPPPSPPAAARPVDRSDLRHQIYVMEGALVRAVSFGAQRLTREIRSVAPEMMVLSGEPQARGVYLDGYGVFFDVGVPILHQSPIWTFQTMLGDDKALADALTVLKQQAKEARTPASRQAMEYAIGRLELQLGLSSAAASKMSLPVGPSGDRPLGAAVVSEPSTPTEAPPSQQAPQPSPQAPSIDRKYLRDPNAINRAYTESVQRALVDAMLDYSLPMGIADDEYLTVGARDNMQRDSLAPADPFEEVVTILLRIKGSDLGAFRKGLIDRAEAARRVQVQEF
jgi:hypothetical protein